MSEIKVIKRNRDIIPTERPAPCESKPDEQNAREITIVIKNWIAESRENKRSQKQFSSLFTLPAQVKSTNQVS